MTSGRNNSNRRTGKKNETRLHPRLHKEQLEMQSLGPFAVPSARSAGRRIAEADCEIRTAYERDKGRILYAVEFRRLRLKTQVFFNPRNDHICTRMEHVLYVNYIAATIGKALNLNVDLIEAIALGHDLGHAPFGHSGEYELKACLENAGADFTFQHELHSLRVCDLLARRQTSSGLNLTFEVRDGIVSHCGERYREHELRPLREKRPEQLIEGAKRHDPPATLEGCVVRMADKIAYIGRDIEDAARAGLMSFEDIPVMVKSRLGRTNGEIIDTLVKDIIEHSYGQDAIVLSRENGQAMEDLLHENVKRIYQSERIKRYEWMARNVIQSLFTLYLNYAEDPEKLEAKAQEDELLRQFRNYLLMHPEPESQAIRKVVDYIAGMTDHFAQKAFEKFFQF